MASNADAVRLVEQFVNETVNSAVRKIFAGQGDDFPSKADVSGQLFIKTGSTNPGLYVSTGTTTPGWKAVSYAS